MKTPEIIGSFFALKQTVNFNAKPNLFEFLAYIYN